MENVHQFPPLIDRIAQREDFIDGKKVHKKRLINKLNAINFKGGTLLVNLRHVKYNHTLIRSARPLPCLGDELACVWAEPGNLYQDLSAYQFLNILVPDGPIQILLKSESVSINEEGLSIRLPETCCVVNRRKAQRYRCKDIQVRLIQNSAEFSGVLLEFCPFSFHIEIHLSPPQTFDWIDPNLSATVIFFDESQTYFSGICKILKHSEGINTRNYVLEPLENQTRRFKPREFRSTRQELLPLPNVIFQHPLIKKTENLKVLDLSGSGFAVEEDKDNPVLLPGMIIPEVELNFAGSFKVDCKVQVVYQKNDNSGENGRRKSGLVLLDMDILEHRRLLALLYQATDGNSYLNNQMDIEALWDFFFESGFIYPQKYAFFQINKDQIKNTYEKLYNSNHSIAQHFVYQDKGRILGHMAMLRFYNNSWLIHHHAAIASASPRAGLAVLNQVGRFLNDSHRLYSAHAKFAFCYFRPENKFPDRIFGGVSRGINDPKGCSLDIFAYFHYRKTINHNLENGDTWTLKKTKPSDLVELKNFYEYVSGGLMMQALGLEADAMDIGTLAEEFKRLGFKRERHLFSLWKNGSLKAIVMANISDIGLNFSDLTNCIQAFIIDPENLPRNVFFKVLSQIVPKFEKDEIPVLLYPVGYAENQSVPYEKLYKLWVLNTEYGDDYFRGLKRLLKHIQH